MSAPRMRSWPDCSPSRIASIVRSPLTQICSRTSRSSRHFWSGTGRVRTSFTASRRKNGPDPSLNEETSSFFYRLMNLMGVGIIRHHSEYRLVSRKALDAIAEYREYNLFLRGIFVDIGYRSDVVLFDVRRRGVDKDSAQEQIVLSVLRN